MHDGNQDCLHDGGMVAWHGETEDPMFSRQSDADILVETGGYVCSVWTLDIKVNAASGPVNVGCIHDGRSRVDGDGGRG